MKKKDNAAQKRFKALTYPHMKLLYNMALRYTQNAFDAEDIVQDTYLMAFNKFHQLRDKSKCKPWLLKILRNNFLKSYHKKKLQQKLPDTDYVNLLKTQMSVSNAENQLVEASTNKLIKDAIDQLPEKYREILLMYYMDDLLYKEIAQILDVPIGTVMSRLTRAREGLKVLLLRQINNEKNSNILNINFKLKNAELSK